MLASHAALCSSTGSLEMLVFHTLLAGNMGQFGAPGTTPVDMTGSPGTCGAVPTVARAVPVLAGTASRVLSCTLRCTLVVDAAPQPATKATPTAIAPTRRPVWHLMTCPFSRRTVTFWHAPTGLSCGPADPATARPFASAHAARHPLPSLESAGPPASAAQRRLLPPPATSLPMARKFSLRPVMR